MYFHKYYILYKYIIICLIYISVCNIYIYIYIYILYIHILTQNTTLENVFLVSRHENTYAHLESQY
jgi:hypothetical protein